MEEFFASERPEYVFLAAARVGGILVNSTRPADFLADNLAIQQNVMLAAWRHRVKKLLFLGSSCIYPRLARQPIREDCLLTGPLEPTNEAYAIAKIAGIHMLRALRQQHGFHGISVMPTNLYGPNDNYNPATSHVLPAMIRRFHEAVEHGYPTVTLWGTGTPFREFLHSDDLADAAVFLMRGYDSAEPVNVGTGEDLPIRQLAGLVAAAAGFHGSILWDLSKPDGTPRKRLDVSRMAAMGWRARVPLEQGIRRAYRDYSSTARIPKFDRPISVSVDPSRNVPPSNEMYERSL